MRLNIKSIWRLLLSTTMLFVLSTTSWSQDLVLTGTVTDGESGEPLPGVNVVIAGTQEGTITNIDGLYEISVSSDQTALNFSFVGYNAENIEIAGRTIIDIQLIPELQALDEVVVIGYGTMRKKDLTGAVSSVQEKDIAANRSTDALGLLQGKVSGMDVVQSSGQAGAGVKITMRGTRSISAGNAPLIIVDGIEYGQTYFDDNGVEQSIPLDINSSDIQSMDVLKDAASTAIYGTRGANGVIIITTKKGGSGKVRVSYNGYASYNSPSFMMPIQNGAQYSQKYIDKVIADEENGIYYNQGVDYDNVTGEVDWNQAAYPTPTDMFGTVTEDDLIAARGLDNRYQLVTTDETAVQRMVDGLSLDYLDMIMVDSWSQNHELSITGGDEKTAFNLSFGFMDDNGLLRKDNMKRYNVKVGVDHKFGNWLKVGADLLYTNKYRFKRNSGIFNQATKCGPIGVLYNEDGTYNLKPDGIMEYNQNNPMIDEVEGAFVNDVYTNRLFGTGYLNFFIAPGLTFRSSLGVDVNMEKEGYYAGPLSLPRVTFGSSESRIFNSQRTKITWDNVLNYSKSFGGDHTLSAMLGSSAFVNQYTISGIYGFDQPLEQTQWFDLNGITSLEAESDYIKQQMLSFFGRVNYNFKDRYLFQATLRADGASVLNENNRWASFPSASVAWRLSEEDFMQGAGWINNLKLRYSWGISGNAAVRPYQSLTLLGDVANYYSFDDGSYASSYVPYQPGNTTLGWEKTTSHNFGLDLSILNNRILGSVDYYMSATDELLFDVPLPSTSGFPVILDNVASTENNGIELAITTVNIQKTKFVWTTDWIFARNKNKVTALRGDVTEIPHDNISGEGFDKDVSSQLWRVGSPVNSYYNYEVDGMYSVEDLQAEFDYVAQQQASGDSIEKGLIPMISNEFYPGNIKLVDQNGDGEFNPDDDKVLANADPDYVFSLVNNLVLKTKVGDFGLDVLVVGRVGQTIAYGLYGRYKTASSWENGAAVEAWTPTNTGADFPRYSSYGNGNLGSFNAPLKYVEASYVKIQDITFSYTLPQAWVNSARIERVRAYVSFRNMKSLVFSNLENYDPENNGSINFPLKQQIFFGLNLDF